jgi:hypothetical protein
MVYAGENCGSSSGVLIFAGEDIRWPTPKQCGS